MKTTMLDNQKTLLPQEDKRVSPVIVVILIMILNIITAIISFEAGRDEMKMRACNDNNFRCNPEDIIIEGKLK